MWRTLVRGGILLPKSLSDRLAFERVARLPNETGGYLLGRRRGPHIEITDATFEGPGDIATRYSFERADKRHARQAVEAWERDGGKSAVVGDWHSHPSGHGSESHTDRTAWRRLAQAERAPAVGVVCVATGPVVYLTSPRRRGLVIRCSLFEETDTELIFGIERLRRWAVRSSQIAGWVRR